MDLNWEQQGSNPCSAMKVFVMLNSLEEAKVTNEINVN